MSNFSSSVGELAASVGPYDVAPQTPGKDRTALRILFVGACTRDFLRLSHALRGPTWKLDWAPSQEAGFQLLRGSVVDVVIYDARLASGQWPPVAQAISSHSAAPVLIAACPETTSHLWAEALNLGARDVVALPFDTAEVLNVLRVAWHERQRYRHSAAAAGA